ncbi:MAG: hypothetical protein DRP71_00175 [Verrucomicrobia bacterium]|nr:MAG: hypothetical protein DRP71_00175 [Verrucomicrobiota bacterium]
MRRVGRVQSTFTATACTIVLTFPQSGNDSAQIRVRRLDIDVSRKRSGEPRVERKCPARMSSSVTRSAGKAAGYATLVLARSFKPAERSQRGTGSDN